MGTLYRNGARWYYQLYLAGPDGRQIRIQKSLGTSDKKLARLRAKELDDRYVRQQIQLTSRVTMQAKVEEYLNARKVRQAEGSLTQNTYRSDVCSLKRFTAFLASNKVLYLNQFEDQDRAIEILNTFMGFRHAQGMAKNTIRRDLRHISSFFSYYVASPRRLLQRNPVSDISLPKPTRRLNFPSQADWLTLRSYLRGKAVSQTITLAEELVWFQIETGCRIGEVLRLKWNIEPTDVIGAGESWSALEEDCRHLRLYSKRRDRVIPIESINDGILLKYLQRKRLRSSSLFVFASPRTNRPLNVSQFSRSFRRILIEANVQNTFSSHGVRHGFISYLVNQGVSSDQIGWLVGHSSTQITDVYIHSDASTLSRVMSALG